MLQKLADHIAEAHIRAAEFEALAGQASNEGARAHYLHLAKSWSNLAKSYAFVESLERFLLDAHYNRHWVVSVENMPMPPVEDE
jgi:uncharacterized membrane protein